MSVKAVLLDWRGTLAVQPSEKQWIANGLRAAGQSASPLAVEAIIAALTTVLGTDPPKEWHQQDTAASLHRDVHLDLFERAGIDRELAAELYRLLSDTQQDVMAEDAPEALARLACVCETVVIVSDVHVDLRPWFTAHALDGYVTGYVLSYEHGVQKPDPEIFRRALDAAGALPEDTLMVGDRAAYDGGAVAIGVPTLILPPLQSPSDRRLHLAVNAASG